MHDYCASSASLKRFPPQLHIFIMPLIKKTTDWAEETTGDKWSRGIWKKNQMK